MSWLLILVRALLVIGGAGTYAAYRKGNKDTVNNKRKTERQAWLEWRQKITSLNPDQKFTSSRSFRASRIERDSPSSLDIRNQDGETVISISEIIDPKPRRWKKISESWSNPIFRLNPLLSAVPTAAAAGNIATTKYMVVQCSGTLSKAENTLGAFEPLVRENGKIVEHARLFPSDQLHNIVAAGALWQIVSIAVAQQHLHEINQKLEIIHRQIEDISAFQKNDRISKVLGCRKYFAQILRDIENGTIVSERPKTAIENQCVEILKVEAHLQIDLQSHLEQMKSANLNESFNTRTRQLVEFVWQLFVCIETRLLGYNLMTIESEEESFAYNRLNEVQGDVAYLKDKVISFADCIVDTLSEKTSFWGSIEKFEEALEVLECLQPRKRFEKSFEHVYDEIKLAQDILEQRNQPQEIVLKVNGGEIDGFSVLENSNS